MAPATYSHGKHSSSYLSTFTILIIVTCICATAKAECKRNQFTCHDGSCILQEKMCDGHRDCPDNSDELKCDMKNCKEPHWFECAQPNGPCLSADLVCNGYENCPGGEDEHDCKETTSKSMLHKILSSLTRNCTKFEYTCGDKSCIPLDFVCDGKKDCADNSDETLGCEKSRDNCKGFLCENNQCLHSKGWVCDGVNDCLDGSDEQHCVNNCTVEAGKFACHDNKTCIELSQVCDDHLQCADESDEGGFCKSATNKCAALVCPPAAKCHTLPHEAATCVCPKGYRLSMLENKCVDIDECLEMYGLCSQKCTNTPGSYKCVCDPGYSLRADNHSCRAIEDHAVLLYTTQVSVMSVELRTKRVFTVAANLSKVIGVAFDGSHIFWTNLENEAESIERANLDGSEQEILLTSGLDAPEDLAVDWLTGNIYFTDHSYQHVAVCSNDGVYCNILVTKNVHHPRGLALWPQLGQMFWTDWGDNPMIARAAMDGTNIQAIVSDNVHWPNGIALDMHNNRVYWVDAKIGTMESARTDGSDRRMILQDILKHPYGLAVFEEKLYWSDWGTKSVHSCNKFTGKDHNVVVKDRTIYAVHIYHKAKQPHTEHACLEAHCSHMCLLTENHTYSCACPYDMELSVDQHRCVKMKKKQKLFVGLKNTILEVEHNKFGRDVVESSHMLPVNVDEMVYNSVNGTLIIADNMRRVLYEYDMVNYEISAITSDNLGNITSLAFDHLSNNVYWTDSVRHSVEVMSMETQERAIVTFFSGQEKPIALTVIPDDGIMFVALSNRRSIHIDQISLSGKGDHVHVVNENLGNRDIRFAVDYDSNILYWTDSDLGRVSFSNYRSFSPYTFRSRLRRPYNLAIVDGDLFWSELKSFDLYWTHLSNEGGLKRFNIEATKESGILHFSPYRLPLAASRAHPSASHPCQHNNGGCSHICTTVSSDASACLCPPGLVFKDLQNRTCIEALDCEFRCVSGECLTLAHRCNSHKDCADGSDEKYCDEDKDKKSIICRLDEFQCHNAKQCVNNDERCDGRKDCKDGSDEDHCEKFDATKNCHQHQFPCHNGKCVDLNLYCDGNNDCEDNSDEEHCDMTNNTHVCAKDMFQCSRGSCIPKKWECDGKLDCTDGSDEHIACGLKDCAPNMHRCLLGQCIDEKLKCDGHNDCGDYSDELNCGGFIKKLSHVCKEHEFECTSNSSICLKMTAKCNGTAECPRGEDEADCGDMCSINEFQCITSKECIRKEFHCDHEPDCLDGSDELHCHFAKNGSSVQNEHLESFCEPGMFDCKDNTCVDQTSVCNNFDDCANGADESPLCKTACSTNTCAHKCRPMPTGALCSCFPGYKLDADKRGCLDINECDLNPCAQICENTQGSYRCSCFPDFMLRTDKVACKSIESNASLYFVSYNEVRSMSENPITLKVAFSANDTKIQGFDIDVHRRYAYFTAAEANSLYSVNMQTGALGTVLQVESPSKVAVDWITGNVYVINREQRYQISVCSFSKRMCGVVVSMPRNEIIKALTIDAYNRKLFYVTMHTLTYGLTFSQINVASLDGRQRKHLVSLNGGYITALALDVHKKQLYFVDSHSKTLQVLGYREGERLVSKTLFQSKNVVSHTTGLTIYENEAFLVNVGSKEAIRCFLFGDFACHALNINVLNAEDILVDGSSRQPLGRDPCSMANCKGMCIQAEYSYECMCGDEIVTESEKCSQVNKNWIRFDTVEEKGLEAGNKGHSMLTIILLLILLIMIAFGYLFYRRKAQGHRDFNINLHFQNPLSSSACGGKSSNSNSYVGASKNCDQEWEKIRFGMPTIQRLLQGKRKNTGTEMLLQTGERNEFCPLGETGQSNVMVYENYVKYDATGAARDESNSGLVTDLI